MHRSRLALAAAMAIAAIVAQTTAAQAPQYREEEITFTNGDVKIAGTLTLPAGNGPFPAVVLLTGSGAQNRDSELLGFRPFRILAEHLARVGVAVLRCDDRGVGGSSGKIADSTTEDFAEDALAAIRLLGSRPEIQKNRVGLLGHSEGALSAAVAASRSRDVSFVVLLAGSMVRGEEVLRQQAADLTRAAGADAGTVEKVLAEHRRLLEAVRAQASDEELTRVVRTLARAQMEALPETQRKAIPDIDAAIEAMLPAQIAAMRSRWLRFFIDFDPATALAKVTCPVLAVFGGRDMQVPPAINQPPLEAALARAGNREVTLKIYPEANHLFMKSVTGNPSEYATLPKAFVPSLLDDLAAWITARGNDR